SMTHVLLSAWNCLGKLVFVTAPLCGVANLGCGRRDAIGRGTRPKLAHGPGWRPHAARNLRGRGPGDAKRKPRPGRDRNLRAAPHPTSERTMKQSRCLNGRIARL